MSHTELSIEKTGFLPEESEILVALLMDAGFESFEEDDSKLRAYRHDKIDEKDIRLIMKNLTPAGKMSYQYAIRKIPEKNWNTQWEKNFSPIVVEDRILVKAPFHHIPELEFTLVIEPKMSFGTGHHETTRLMLRHMLLIDFSDKEVLDMGCGTGVLGIAAKMMGASYVLAVDIDHWAYQNTYENFQRNRIHQPFDVLPGDRKALEGHTFHVILANINRNVLMEDIPVYFYSLKDHGTLVISGILIEDKDAIVTRATVTGFTFVSSFYENNWISLNLRK